MARRELGPASLAVLQAVAAAMTDDDRHVLVACSGGADSLALAFGAQRVGARLGRPVGAAIVDHGLQPGSTAVAARARDQLSSLGLAPVRVLTVQIDATDRSGPEGAARSARYAALDAEAAANHATVLLGHTLDDQAETVLLGLARGSGPRSLAGMAQRSGRLLRPLLGLRRSVTQQACRELGLEPWTDPQNDDRQFTRVRVRHTVLPVLEAELGPGIAEALARTADLARDDADLLDQLAAAADPGTDTLDCAALLDLPAALRTRVIRRWLLRHGVPEPTAVHVGMVAALVTAWRGQESVDLPRVRVLRQAGHLTIQPARDESLKN
ncbi:MAG TPA: tRNA lysidine(34) synthetase TilS [Propionibacteriaceae bacterium]|nr:tRNA lysidine(34) synthetase TilS [Propionibacteriaceae bacterium]